MSLQPTPAKGRVPIFDLAVFHQSAGHHHRFRSQAVDRRCGADSPHLAASREEGIRISVSLDLDTVLHEISESARALTGARYCAIATIDETGEPVDFVTSGLTEEEHRNLAAWPDGPRLFEHFRDFSGPLRLSDAAAHVRALGYASDRLPYYRTFLGMPMRHQGRHVGNFYLVEKESGHEFAAEDEELLVLFASQAATAIANARAYRDEQRAGADLEALVDTSPIGVAVFDARTGMPVSLNREMRRIVGSLRTPGRAGRATAAGHDVPVRRRARDRRASALRGIHESPAWPSLVV